MPGPSDRDASPTRGRACRTLPIFFLLTFACTWAAWLGPAALAPPGAAGLFGVGGPVFLLGVFAPGLVALALTALGEGFPGVRRLLARIGLWRVGWRWYLFAVGYLASVKLTASLIHRATTGAWPAFGDTPWPLMLAAIPISTWVQAGEEVGWREYALPRLASRLGLGGAGMVLGVLWALWHLPLFFLTGTDKIGQPFPIYLMSVTALSVAMAWLYWETGGSLLLVMLMHASVNNTTNIVPAAVPGAHDPFSLSGSPLAWITIALSWGIAALLLLRMRRAALGAMIDQAG